MASPKVEILLSIAKAQAVRDAEATANAIASKMTSGLGTIRFNAFLEIFNKARRAAAAFYDFIAKNNAHIKEAGDRMAENLNKAGNEWARQVGAARGLKSGIESANEAQKNFAILVAQSSKGVQAMASAYGYLSKIVTVPIARLLDGIAVMQRFVGLAKEVQTKLDGSLFVPEDSAVRSKQDPLAWRSSFKNKRFKGEDDWGSTIEANQAEIDRRAKDAQDKAAEMAATARERRSQETARLLASGQLELPPELGGGFEARNQGDPLKVQIENMGRQAELNAEQLAIAKADDAQKELLAEREADRQQAQLQVKFDAIAAIGKAGEDEILITQARDEYLAQLAENRLLSEEEQYKREQSIRESAGKALEALENKKMAEDRKRTAEKKMLMQQYGNVIASGMAGAIAEAAKGQESLGDILKKALGGMLTSMGTMLIQMGTAAVLAGTLGTLVPIFAPMTGGPAGVTAGVAAIAGGALMVAAGSAMTGSARAGGGRGPGAVTSASGPGTGGFGGRMLSISSDPDASLSRSSREFERDTAQDRSVVVNVNMGTGIVHGTPERLSREIGLATQGALGRLG